MRLCSINTSAEYSPLLAQGKTIKTGFHKTPKDAGFVSLYGLTGDVRTFGDGMRDRAVLLYQVDAYEYWRKELNQDLPYGRFGENLTFSGPEDDFFHIGDQLRIGSVVLEVNAPRFPCFKLSARLEDDSIVARYMKSGKLGFFCTVLEEGEIRVGDEIVVHRRTTDAAPINIPEFTRVMALETDDVEGLERLLASNHLLSNWRAKAEPLLRKARGEGAEWASFQPYTVVSKKPSNLSESVVSLTLEASSGAELPQAEAGQFVTLRLPVLGEAEGIIRTYTISESHQGRYRIDVKREQASPEVSCGQGSSYLHDLVQVGDTIEALSARGHFTIKPSHRPLVLCSAGIGITPMLAMLAEQAASENPREVYFVHGSRSGEDLVQRDRVQQLIGSSERMHGHLSLSNPSPSDLAAGDFDAVGRVTPQTLQDLCPGLDADFYFCGPPHFIRDLVTGLVDLEVPREQIHYEYFGAGDSLFPEDYQAGEQVYDEDGNPIQVTFLQAGITTAWTDTDTSLMQLARRVGLSPAASCEHGICSTCKIPMRAGAVKYFVDLVAEPKENEILPCAAAPCRSVILDQ